LAELSNCSAVLATTPLAVKYRCSLVTAPDLMAAPFAFVREEQLQPECAEEEYLSMAVMALELLRGKADQSCVTLDTGKPRQADHWLFRAGCPIQPPAVMSPCKQQTLGQTAVSAARCILTAATP
jgi:hypothetical protein